MNDNMNTLQRLNHIHSLLLEYEDETLPLSTCPIDDIDDYIEKRSAIMEKIVLQNKAIQNECDSEPTGLLKAAAFCSCDRSDLSEELREIFDAKLMVNAVLTRIISAEKQASERIAFERDELISKIKSMNQSANANAAKYYDASRYKPDEYFFHPESKKI